MRSSSSPSHRSSRQAAPVGIAGVRLNEFVITSEQGVRCVFHSRSYEAGRLDGYSVELDALDFHAATGVGNPGYGHSPAQFFARLAAQWTGWPGTESWRSMDGEMAIAATCDRTGHVTLTFMIPAPTSSGIWSASASIMTTAGQLDRLADRAAKFLNDGPESP